MRKKIAIVTPFFHGIGGGETFVHALKEETEKKFHVDIFTLKYTPAGWQGLPIFKSIILTLSLVGKMIKYKARLCSLYHAQGIIALLACLIYSYLLFPNKVFVTILALYDFKKMNRFLRRIIKTILNRADKIFVEGENGRQDILDCGVKENKIITFSHWVDLEKYKPTNRTWDDLRVLFVGRPIRIKGKYIVENLERSLYGFDKIKFKYIEHLPHEQLTNEYKNSDILIVPSQYSEGFPRVVFEAMACGCVVIGSRFGSLPELLKDCGYIENYEQNIMSLLDKEHLQTKQNMARKYAEKFFSHKNADVFLKEYE